MVTILQNDSLVIDGNKFFRVQATETFKVQVSKAGVETPYVIQKGTKGGYVCETILVNSWVDENAYVKDCHLNNTLVQESRIQSCVVKASKIAKSELRSYLNIINSDLSECEIDYTDEEKYGVIDNSEIRYAKINAYYLTIRNSVLKYTSIEKTISLQNCKFAESKLIDSELNGVNAGNATVDNSTVTDTFLQNCEIILSDLTKSNVDSSKVTYSIFNYSRISNSIISKCSISNATLAKAYVTDFKQVFVFTNLGSNNGGILTVYPDVNGQLRVNKGWLQVSTISNFKNVIEQNYPHDVIYKRHYLALLDMLKALYDTENIEGKVIQFDNIDTTLIEKYHCDIA